MATEFSPLTLTSAVAPQSQDELIALVTSAFRDSAPLYPIGGATSLEYGLPPKTPGVGVVLTGLNRVIDFPARDLTITVEAGITMQALAEVLAKEGLRLPIDVPLPERATLGGVIATAWSGPRRYGHGTIRDYVIGIRAVDGRGEVFNGGGRVVKNVAGYDFCKLLTGSLGTLGIICQVTLKLKPLPQATAIVSGDVQLTDIDELLTAVAHSDITPAAVELSRTTGAWTLSLLLEGTGVEVGWLQARAIQILSPKFATIDDGSLPQAWIDFPVGGALVLKASVLSSRLVRFLAAAEAIANVDVHAHAGNGIVYIKFSELPPEGLSRTLVGKLQPLAAECGGHVVVLANPSGQEATPQCTWGNLGGQLALMTAVKQQFDPRNILNPGRYVFPR